MSASREVICGPYFEIINVLLSFRILKNNNLVLIVTWEMRSSVVHISYDPSRDMLQIKISETPIYY